MDSANRNNNLGRHKVTSGFCKCGCGEKTTIIKQSDVRKGYVKGDPHAFLKGHHNRVMLPLKRRSKSGRLLIYLPVHHRSHSNGYVFNSLLVAEKALGYPVPFQVEVHHVNGDFSNDNNLVICPGRKYHSLLHQRERALRACGNANWRKCQYCKKHDDPQRLCFAKKSVFHKECRNKHRRELRAAKKKGDDDMLDIFEERMRTEEERHREWF